MGKPSSEFVEKPNSVEISRNARGDVAFKVKAYADDLARASAEAMETFNDLCGIFGKEPSDDD